MSLPPTQSSGGAATQCTPGMDYGSVPGGTYACNAYTLKGWSGENPNGEPPLVNTAARLEPTTTKQTP